MKALAISEKRRGDVASEYLTAKAFLYQRLSSALSVATYEAPAPSTATYPFVTYSLEPQPDIRYKGGAIWTSFESVVRVVGKGSVGSLAVHLDALESAVGMASGTAQGRAVECERIAPFRLPPYYQQGSNELVQEIGLRVQVRIKGG